MNAHLLSDKARLSSSELARLHAKYSNVPDVLRLWDEIDALRFDLAAANERTRIAREERNSLEDQLWRLRMVAVKGGKI